MDENPNETAESRTPPATAKPKRGRKPSAKDLDAVAAEQQAAAQTSAGIEDPERTPREPIGPTNFQPVEDASEARAPRHHYGDTFRHAVKKVEHAIEKGAAEAGEALGTAIGEAGFDH